MFNGKGIVFHDNETASVSRVSPFTGIGHTKILPITRQQVEDWRNGKLLQCAFPQLDADDREFLMTGITGPEWNEEFGS